MVLRGGAEQSDTANVDLLDGVSERAARLCNGLCERVQVADNDRDGRDVLRLEVGLVRGNGTRKDTCLFVP